MEGELATRRLSRSYIWGLEAKVRGGKAIVSIARRWKKLIESPRTT